MRVLKFGGTSVATAARRATVAEVVACAAGDEEVLVVISALAGVTDQLAAAADGRCRNSALLCADLEERHLGNLSQESSERVRPHIARHLRRLESLQPCRATSGKRHEILATGERLALSLVMEALQQRGLAPREIDGAELVVTCGGGPEPDLDLEATRRRLHARFRPGVPGRITVVPGFVARDRRGQTTTLGRGASDLSATLLGALLEASRVEIWTDVDGVLSAPPAFVAEATSIPHLSYGEAATMAHFGARVLHPLALAPVREVGIPVVVRNTLNPLRQGTRIEGASHSAGVQGISFLEEVSRFLVWLPWSRRRPGRLLAELEELGLRPLLVASEMAAQALSLVVRKRDARRTDAALERLLGPESHVEHREELAVVAAVGAFAEGGIWVEHRLREALREEGIEALGVSRQDHAVTVLVDSTAGKRAVRATHAALIVAREEVIRREAA